jgi:hypothetical protein
MQYPWQITILFVAKSSNFVSYLPLRIFIYISVGFQVPGPPRRIEGRIRRDHRDKVVYAFCFIADKSKLQ